MLSSVVRFDSAFRGALGRSLCSLAFVLSIVLTATGCGPAPSSGSQGNGSKLEARVLGTAAPGLLKAEPYSELVVEIAAVKGLEPDQDTLDYLKEFLGRRLNKPDGIRIVVTPSFEVTGNDSVGITELNELEAKYRTIHTDGKTISVFILIVDGSHVSDSSDFRTMGLAYRATSIVLFGATISNVAVTAASRKRVTKTVLTHEFGHILGLVNVGTPMVNDHYDHEHNAGHCSNPKCLMNFAVNSGGASTLHSDTALPDFDENCLKDLRAAGGK